jgi:hypothetical protein
MSLYWCFRLDPVARRVLYLEELKQTETFEEVDAVLHNFRARRKARPWESIPV